MTTLPALLADRVRTDGASPFVTFYDDATGERTELSATTFANWVAKTANLLVDGLGVGRGDDAVLSLPPHWQSLVVAAGCWAAGMTVRFDGPADVAFVAEDGPRPAADETVVLSLRPLGAGLAVPDAAVTDYAVEVRTHGDRFVGEGPDESDEALPGRSQADLSAESGDAERRLLTAPGALDTGLPDTGLLDTGLLVAAYVRPLIGGGSVVLCRRAAPALLERRRETEHAI